MSIRDIVRQTVLSAFPEARIIKMEEGVGSKKITRYALSAGPALNNRIISSYCASKHGAWDSACRKIQSGKF